MAVDDGITFMIADRNDEFVQQLAGVNGETDTLRNGIPTAAFTLDDDDEAVEHVWAEGARCWWRFRGQEFRGIISECPRDPRTETLKVTVVGDARKLWEWLGWQVPGADLDGQSAAEYWRMTGPTETVVKAALSENFARLGVPWTCAPSQGRGLPNATLELRMHPLGDRIAPLLDAAGLTLTLTYPPGGGVVVDVREPATAPGVFTIKSGVPGGVEYNRQSPTATRAVVGGRGEGVERQFAQVVDTAREAAWGDIVEVFVDARNTDAEADIAVDGQEAIDEGAPRVGLSMDLVETDLFMYGDDYVEGDLVEVAIGPVTGRHPITGVSVTEDPDEGVVVTPRIGAVDVAADTDVRLARAVARLARTTRDQGRR